MVSTETNDTECELAQIHSELKADKQLRKNFARNCLTEAHRTPVPTMEKIGMDDMFWIRTHGFVVRKNCGHERNAHKKHF